MVDSVDASIRYSNQDDADDWYFHVGAKDNDHISDSCHRCSLRIFLTFLEERFDKCADIWYNIINDVKCHIVLGLAGVLISSDY